MERNSHAQQVSFHFGTNTESWHKTFYRNKEELPRLLFIRVLKHFRVGQNLVNYIIFR